MEIKPPNVSPHSSDDGGDDPYDDEGDAPDDEVEGKTAPYEEEENDDVKQHNFSVI